jgi:hypothetical protein
MSYITKDKFKELAEITAPNCISIYIPTSPSGDRNEDKIRFKNQIQKLEKQLEELGLDERERDAKLKPARKLLEDTRFWNNLSYGLAVFIYENTFQTFISEHEFETQTYLNDHLHLLQLIKDIGNKEFHLLILSGNTVKLYQGDEVHLEEMEMDDDFPKSMTDAIGEDYEQKSLQFRSGLTESESGVFHGHGSGSDAETKKEFEKFFHALDDALNKHLPSEGHRPLIIASDEHTFHHFKNVSSYPNLFEKPLAGNHEETSETDLLKMSLKLLGDNTDSSLKQAKTDFQEMVSKGESSADLTKVVGAAYNGQVAELFVEPGTELPGYFDPQTNELTLHESSETSSVDLLNLAAVHTVVQGGKVYLLEKDEMPVETAPLNANFRYEVVSA